MSIVKLPQISKYNIFTTAALIITTIIILSLATSENFSCIRKNQCIVECDEYDSLVAIANRPPRIDTIIHVDTVPGKPIIKYKDKLVPVYKDSLNAVYKDTLKTQDFQVVTTDTLRYNRLQYRKYDYEVYRHDTTIIKEVEKPVYRDTIIYREKSKRGLYYGGTVGGYATGAKITGDLTFITKKDGYVKIGAGGLGDVINNKVYPIFEFGIGKKFKF